MPRRLPTPSPAARHWPRRRRRRDAVGVRAVARGRSVSATSAKADRRPRRDAWSTRRSRSISATAAARPRRCRELERAARGPPGGARGRAAATSPSVRPTGAARGRERRSVARERRAPGRRWSTRRCGPRAARWPGCLPRCRRRSPSSWSRSPRRPREHVEALQTTLAAEHAAVFVFGTLGGRTSQSGGPGPVRRDRRGVHRPPRAARPADRARSSTSAPSRSPRRRRTTCRPGWTAPAQIAAGGAATRAGLRDDVRLAGREHRRRDAPVGDRGAE